MESTICEVPEHMRLHLDLFITQQGFGYNTDQALTPNGPVWLYIYIFYSHYNMDWIANMEIVLDPNKSVIKRLRCVFLA